MTRNWKALGLTALLVAAVGTAQGRPDPEKPNVNKQLEDIEGILRTLSQNFDTLRREVRDVGVRGAQVAQDVRDMQERVAALDQRLRSQESMLRGVQAATQDVRDLQERVVDLEQRLRAQDATARRAFSLPPAQDLRDLQERLAALERQLRSDERRFSFTPEAPRRAGTLRLQNRSAYGATVRVNGNPYFVPAFETRLVQGVPTGTFNYDVSADGFGVILPTVSRTLNPGETFVVYVNP